MTWIDLLILAVIAISVVSAFIKGFLVELFSLAGVVLGFLIAAADYGRLAPWIDRWVRDPRAGDLIAFILIALGIMAAASLAGHLLRGTIRRIGLGFVDRLLGALFGFLKGCAVITIAVMAIAAFLPRADWLKSSKLAPFFLAAARDGSHMTPLDLGEKIREGVRLLRTETT
ncbi:MAG TPA: CvpA family protein [Acidobacteriaceae bacterium]|nr:CvpA family protein [Acidobacteriaceae bacterium]